MSKLVFRVLIKYVMAYTATIINLSSGRILFNDPSESPAWDPASLGANPPVFPSTSLAIGVDGTIANRNIESIAFTNIFQYQSYENSTTMTTLQKSLLINKDGVVTYEDPKIGVVSTVVTAFSATVSTFVNSTIGGINIYDTESGTPDTLTNAIGKIDGWIANAFLLQPPAVTPIVAEDTSLYGGIRWLNPRVYSVLDKSVPYVSGILFIIGTPGSGNVFSFEMTDCSFFPYKGFRDGISPYGNPLVRLRIFTDFFPQTADVLYTRATMATNSISIIESSGNANIPTTGRVFAIDYTDGQATYTTVSVYLPNLTNSYPKLAPVPVQIAYINKTEGTVNIAYTSTVTNVTGYPSLFEEMLPISTSPSSLTIRVRRPEYSDVDAQISTAYFSTNSLQYTYNSLATAHSGNIGFRYGVPDPTTIPPEFNSYIAVTMTQDFVYILSTQTMSITGSVNPVIPGIVWETTGFARNSAGVQGLVITGPTMSTIFPPTILPPLPSSIIQNVSLGPTRYKNNSLKYLSYQNGWNAGYNVSTDVFFLSTPSRLSYELNVPVQLNDPTFPGDRSNITFYNQYTNTNNISFSTTRLQLSTFNDNFPLNTYLSTYSALGDVIGVTIQDPYITVPYQKYFYSAQVQGQQYLSTVSTALQSIQIFQNNDKILGYNTAINYTNLQSTSKYTFSTEPSQSPSTINILYNNVCLSTVRVSGLLTPSLTSQFKFDIVANDFAYMYSANRFADARMTQDVGGYDVPIGPSASYSTGVYIYNNTTNAEITTLPFPVSTIMRISTCSLSLYSTIYQNPTDPGAIKLTATVTPANPEGVISTFVSSLTANMYIDTVSLTTYSTFSDINGTKGIRVVSLLPRAGIGATAVDIKDSIDLNGRYGIGLTVNTDPYFTVGEQSNITMSSGIIYQHASTIGSVFPDYYSRELLYTNGKYIHPAGYDFSQFSGQLLGQPTAVYPNFTTDLIADINNGFRYATFAFQSQQYAEPTEFQYLNILVKNPNIVSTISENYYENNWFPNQPIVSNMMSTLQVRIQAKVYSSYTDYRYQAASTIWYDCLQLANDDMGDYMPACVSVSTIGTDVQYKVQIDRHAYTRLCSVVRIGLSKDSGLYAGSFPYPISFDSIQTSYSDF